MRNPYLHYFTNNGLNAAMCVRKFPICVYVRRECLRTERTSMMNHCYADILAMSRLELINVGICGLMSRCDTRRRTLND